jgi:excisionase family DNA binding protein
VSDQDWVSLVIAAAQLGVSVSTIRRLLRTGDLTAVRQTGAWRIDAQRLESLVNERSRWISHQTAADLTGIPLSTVSAAAMRGELPHRKGNHSLPSLDRAEVERWAEARRRRQEERETRRRERVTRSQPPTDGRVWLDVDTVAVMLGCSPRWVRVLAQDDRLPHTQRGRRIWFVREHIEEYVSALAFEQRQSDSSQT